MSNPCILVIANLLFHNQQRHLTFLVVLLFVVGDELSSWALQPLHHLTRSCLCRQLVSAASKSVSYASLAHTLQSLSSAIDWISPCVWNPNVRHRCHKILQLDPFSGDLGVVNMFTCVQIPGHPENFPRIEVAWNVTPYSWACGYRRFERS
jgi:ABC-type polysaccharide/polyol phosphate export permease